jgi:hypothetical protein
VSVDVGTRVFVAVGDGADVFADGWVWEGVGDGASDEHEVKQRQTIKTSDRADLRYNMMAFLPH